MFRFGSIALGIFLLAFGAYTRWLEAPMSANPAAVSLEEVSRLSDLARLRDDFGEGVHAEGLRLALGRAVDPETTYVVLADGREPLARPAYPSLPRVLAPVTGAETLFVALDWDEAPVASGRIAGVLERLDFELDLDLDPDLDPDARASVIRRVTPQGVNRERVSTANFTMGLGAALAGFGVALIFAVELLKRAGRELRRAHR